MKILIFTDWFAPAYKAGGPVRSVVNMVNLLKKDHAIYVFTKDRDLKDAQPFQNIAQDEWMEADGFRIYHYGPGKMTLAKVRSVVQEIQPDRIYLNSMFSNMFLPMWVAAKKGNVILCTRGMLRQSALSVKWLRKFVYLNLLKLLGLDKQLTFHATSNQESKDIRRVFPKADKISVAPNLPEPVLKELPHQQKKAGELHMIFVGRMHPIKNLLFLLEALQRVKGNIHFDIVATREDEDYWKKCKKLIFGMQTKMNIVTYADLKHQKVRSVLEKCQLFVLPTEGENFGHAIFEALAVGCPILISDQTPWRDLSEKKAGIDLSLSRTKFTEAMQYFVDMEDAAWQAYRKGALAVAADYVKNMNSFNAYQDLFALSET
jgi:glycosyltransferase involved in cell wall biosynthesis